jgi:transposase
VRLRDVPAGYGPHKIIYSRFLRWSRPGVFNRILAELVAQGGGTGKLMIDDVWRPRHVDAALLFGKLRR